MMRVLYVSAMDIRREGSDVTHFIEVATGLQRQGVDLLMVLPSWSRTDRFDHLPRTYVPTPSKSLLGYLIYETLLMIWLPYLFLTFRPHAVYYRLGPLSLFEAGLSRLFRRTAVTEINGLAFDELRVRGFPRIICWISYLTERMNYMAATRLVVVTDGLKKRLCEDFGVPPERVNWISNGANTDLFVPHDQTEARRRLEMPVDSFVVGFVGALAPWQGLEQIIGAAKLIKGRLPIRFLIVGDGERRAFLEERIQEDGLGEIVQLTGRVRYTDVPWYIGTFDLCLAVFTRSRNDKIGLSPLKLFEYMACGRAVIGSDTPGVTEVIDGHQCGRIVVAEDAAALAGAIEELYYQRSQLPAMGEAARRAAADHYSWYATARKVKDLLIACAGRTGHRP